MATINITDEKILSDKKYLLKEVHFEMTNSSGQLTRQKREVFSHGNAVAALLYNQEEKKVILTKQFRMASYLNGNKDGMLLEACAGLLEEGEKLEEAMRREIAEETGYDVKEVKKLFEAYSSPGAFTELIHYFIAPYTTADKTGKGGGLAAEQEDVTVLEIPFSDAINMIASGEIKDAKTILLLQYAKIHIFLI